MGVKEKIDAYKECRRLIDESLPGAYESYICLNLMEISKVSNKRILDHFPELIKFKPENLPYKDRTCWFIEGNEGKKKRLEVLDSIIAELES